MVWKTHHAGAWRCRCPKCLIDLLDVREAQLEAHIEARRSAEGAVPAWAEEARAVLQRDRTEVERAIGARGVQPVIEGQTGERKGHEERAAFKQAA